MSDQFIIAEETETTSGAVPKTPALARDNWRSEVHAIGPPKIADLWHNFRALPFYLPLLKALIWRALSIRYAQSLLGVLWVVLQPIATTLVIFFMFNIIKVNTSDGANQGLFLLAGIMTWQLFARGLQDASVSLNSYASILTKIYLPKMLLPFTAVAASWFDTLVAMALLVIACLTFGIPLTERALLLPVFLMLVSLASLSIGLGLAPINALFRDISVILPFALQFAMYATPVLYSARFIPERWHAVFYLNPMTSLIEGVRWSMLPESPAPDPIFLAINILTILSVLTVSLLAFQKLESIAVDRI
jgi:lipopolysaccharide transport system permease protein